MTLAATAVWGQESTLSVTLNGIEVRFLTKVEPPGDNARSQLPGGVVINPSAPDRAHHTITDSANKRYFGYDLRVEPRGDGNTVQLWIEPLSGARARVPIEPGWTLITPPKYPVIPLVKLGDTVAIDLLVNRATGQKVVDYLTVNRSGFEAVAASRKARDFSLADVELTLDRPRVQVNGKLVEATANYPGGASGTVAWLYIEGHGKFVISLFPNAKLGFQKNGVTARNTLTFREGSTEYSVQCAGNVAPGSRIYNLYVVHEAGWRPRGTGEPFVVGSADNAEWVVGKH